MNIFLTGKPGSGKTTLVKELLGELEGETCGFFTPEIRESGERTGFKLKEVNGDEEGVLASVDLEEGPSVSKYNVNLDDLDQFSERIMDKMKDSDIVVIDEIGVMELYSDKFEELLERAMDSDKLLLATLHRNLIDKYQERGKVIWVTRKSGDELKEKVLEVINYS